MTDREKFEAWFADVQKPAMIKSGIKLAEQNLCHDVALMAWQAALFSQGPADDGWIEWRGGECPVGGDSLVNVKYEGGGEDMESKPAKIYDWSNNKNYCYPIIAYRVVKP